MPAKFAVTAAAAGTDVFPNFGSGPGCCDDESPGSEDDCSRSQVKLGAFGSAAATDRASWAPTHVVIRTVKPGSKIIRSGSLPSSEFKPRMCGLVTRDAHDLHEMNCQQVLHAVFLRVSVAGEIRLRFTVDGSAASLTQRRPESQVSAARAPARVVERRVIAALRGEAASQGATPSPSSPPA